MGTGGVTCREARYIINCEPEYNMLPHIFPHVTLDIETRETEPSGLSIQYSRVNPFSKISKIQTIFQKNYETAPPLPHFNVGECSFHFKNSIKNAIPQHWNGGEGGVSIYFLEDCLNFWNFWKGVYPTILYW